MSSTPRYPRWLDEQVAGADAILNLDPFPFAQPRDTTGYLSLHQNDYLRLSDHPDAVAAREEANRRFGVQAFASSVYGRTHEEERFGEELGRSLRSDGVVFTTAGWTANVGLLQAIVPRRLPVYLDGEAHASLFDGLRQARGRLVAVRHNDPDHLEARVRRLGPGVVCIDALCSSDGSIPELSAYVETCERHDCVLVLDEAHSFGMMGPGGGGLAVALGLEDRVHFRTGSLSKALGGHGGFIAARGDVLIRTATQMHAIVFSSATSAILHAGHSAALRVAQREPERAERALRAGAIFAERLRDAGLDVRESRSHIVSAYFRGDAACRVWAALRDRRVLASVFVPPAAPRGESFLRFSWHSEVSEADAERAANEAIAAIEAVAPDEVMRLASTAAAM